MGLTTCPDCRAEVSDVAPTCPKCGRPLKCETSSVLQCYTCRTQATTKCQRCGEPSCVTHLYSVAGAFMLTRMTVCDNCQSAIRFWNRLTYVVVFLLLLGSIIYFCSR